MPYTNYTFQPKPSANFRSQSERFKPTRSSTPGPIYEVHDDRGITVRGLAKGSSPFVSVTPRFKERVSVSPSAFDYNTDAPPAYTRATGGAAAFKSSTQRFPERRSTTPDPGMYDPSDDRVIGASKKAAINSAFRSQSDRFHAQKGGDGVGPYLGAYAPGDIAQRATSSTKPSAAFKSTAARFKENQRVSGPGLTSYLEVYDTPRASTRPTSVFRSQAERFPKAKTIETVSHYDITDPGAIGASGRSRSPSAAFKSSTPRFTETRNSSPGMQYDIEGPTRALSSRSPAAAAAFRSKAPRFRESKMSPTPTYDVRYPTDIAVEVERRARF